MVGDRGGDAVGRVGGRRGGRRGGPIETMPALEVGARGGRPGSGATASEPPRRWERHPDSPRLVSVWRKGLAVVLAALVMGRGVVLGSWCPEPWPHIPPGIQVEYHEPNPDLVGKKTYPCEPPGPPFVRGEKKQPGPPDVPPLRRGGDAVRRRGGFFASAPGRALSNCEAL